MKTYESGDGQTTETILNTHPDVPVILGDDEVTTLVRALLEYRNLLHTTRWADCAQSVIEEEIERADQLRSKLSTTRDEVSGYGNKSTIAS